MSGLLRPVSGNIVLDNKQVSSLEAYRIARSGLALVPEGRQVFGELDVRDNLLLGAFSRNDADLDREIETLLNRFPRLRERLTSRAGLLSGGEQQMLAIARGLMANPQLLMLDEPSLGLAPAMINELFDILAELRDEGVTILLVDQMAALGADRRRPRLRARAGPVCARRRGRRTCGRSGAGGGLSRGQGKISRLRGTIRAGTGSRKGSCSKHETECIVDFDLILREARIAGQAERTTDIGISKGRIAAVAADLPKGAPEKRLDGRLVVPGFIETHIHLDKSCLLGRCQCDKGTLDEAILAVADAKRGFTEEDVYERASRTLEKAIKQGTTRMRTHVEVDPRIGLTSLKALLRLKKDYAFAIDLQLCVFPQEGLLDDPGCEDVMVAALEAGADVVGGAPYMDKDSHGQIARIFALAQRFNVDIDFHLDFGLDTAPSRRAGGLPACRRDRLGRSRGGRTCHEILRDEGRRSR